ncbi:endonuclease/exonuclease/phosphatase family protein [Desulforhopalus singaporensis]|uniref:Metal-dependent hydrolase, endonuclease/exonuclease/phosphatase family n=1 Tax=Desulforhopalus singaporensis TaxID=91360 RepID=A0A1H0QYH2_9BACT|nr:endonuclease/exonuclease/phosphatase family protein [Desulforhopalus singaporensis]SDP22277.1 Metal-dependent hydrolase, endonuclease/exonuclease/phosphatase family [Desulforhopalus singaporensis]
MRLLFYNIRYGTGHKKGYHLPLPFTGFFKPTVINLHRIISFIRSIDPDIIALVEVDTGSYRAAYHCQAQLIADKLGYDCIVERKYQNDSLALRVPLLNKQANALLTKQSVEQVQFHYFDKGVKRLVIQTDLRAVAIFIVHLSLKYRHRQNQLEQLHSLIQETDKEVIVAGDFNTFWGSRELSLFLAATGLKNANLFEKPSHPSHAPHRQIDFILHSAGLSIDNFYIPDIRLSDHSPLVCDFSCVLD